MKNELNALTDRIIGGAIAVHREIGPGALESTYEACLTFELLDRGLVIERQKALRLSRHKVGLLINFNVKWLADRGIKRIVNGFPD
jgi:hypothetical protein